MISSAKGPPSGKSQKHRIWIRFENVLYLQIDSSFLTGATKIDVPKIGIPTSKSIFQVIFTCSNSTIETLEAGANMFKINNKNPRNTSLTSFWCFYWKIWTYFKYFSSVSTVEFQQVNASWVNYPLTILKLFRILFLNRKPLRVTSWYIQFFDKRTLSEYL